MSTPIPASATAFQVDENAIQQTLDNARGHDYVQVREILAKAALMKGLSMEDVSHLMDITEPDLLDELYHTAKKVKEEIYGNRIVLFAPLYISNLCGNECVYCAFRASNKTLVRRSLSQAEIAEETRAMIRTGQKRIVLLAGEAYPKEGLDYVLKAIKTVYETKEGHGEIRRVNVEIAPLSVEDFRRLKAADIGTYITFQETYHKATYEQVHLGGKKRNFEWRVECMDRAMEAGIEDVGIGSLYGLSDWRFEILATIQHADDLERQFGLGPHTVSFPRLEPAHNTPLASKPPYEVSDADFLRIVTVMRLALPYVGLIVTAREGAEIRRQSFKLGITQTDASSAIGVGAYHDTGLVQASEKQQFMLGDTRPLQDVVLELAEAGSLTSFCTAGYRCGRTGKCIMDLLRNGTEGKFCKLNAALTFKEWIDDFADADVKAKGEALLTKEVAEISEKLPHMYVKFKDHYERTINGERDLYF